MNQTKRAMCLVFYMVMAGLAACSQTRIPLAVVPDAVQPTAVSMLPSTQLPIQPTPTETAIVMLVPPTLTPIATSTAVPTPTPLPPVLENPRNIRMSRLAAEQDAEFAQISQENTGIWRYTPQSFVHPIALEVEGDRAYLLDSGRVLAVNLADPTSPQLLLEPGDNVAGVQVMEPLDLALAADGLLVLDRVGDVYHYDGQTWTLARYDRPIGEMSSHYYVALTDQVLLEPSYNFALQFEPEAVDRFWLLPEEARPVDGSTVLSRTYALVQDIITLTATVSLYEDTTLIESFKPDVSIEQPRQIIATNTAVYVLDQGGRRLLVFHPDSGDLQRLVQLPPVTAFWTDGRRLILAGYDQLYFVGEPDRWQTVQSDMVLTGLPPHDTAVWQNSGSFIVPVQGTHLGIRELQMPGAPRHYRLGVHEGVDFYWGAGTPVRAVTDGVVIRAMHDYELPGKDEFDRRREQVKQTGHTPDDYLDFYRGMQIWIEHADGTVARYAHLSEIEEAITEGTAVTQGQIIGKIGNTGSPASSNGPNEDAHLHFELWQAGHYLGQYLRPVEVRELIMQLFELR